MSRFTAARYGLYSSLVAMAAGLVISCAESTSDSSLAAVAGLEPFNQCLWDVEKSFGDIPQKVRSSSLWGSTQKYLGAKNTLVPWPRYTSQADNDFGLGEHFQGIGRFGWWGRASGQHFVISGGIKNGSPQMSQLVVFEMGSQSDRGPWALPSYGYSYESPPSSDRTVAVVNIDETYWHAGGIQALDHVVAIPIYGDGSGSEIRYYDFADPGAPSELSALRLLRPHSKSKAVAMTRLPDDHYVTLVWDDNYLEFHRSISTDFAAGFASAYHQVSKSEVAGGFQNGGCGISGCGTYQSINLVNQCDGTVYLVAGRNTQKASPTITGTDYAGLYRVDWPGGDYSAKPTLTHVELKQFYCYNQQCNFGAAIGIYVDDEDHMFLYGASHWLHDGNARYNFNEYSY